MAMWKICRQGFGNEEFSFREGEQISVGRGFDNKVTLSSIVVSRNHCTIKIQKDNILITDLNSSNGTYVGTKKIPTKCTFTAKDGDIIGFGWTSHIGAFRDITDNDKHVFKLIRVKCNESIASRIQYLSESDDNLEDRVAALDEPILGKVKEEIELRPHKRKSYDTVDTVPIKVKKEPVKESIGETFKQDPNVIDLLSDSDNESTKKQTNNLHTNRMVSIPEELPGIKEELIKTENEIPDYEAFDIKQEYLGFDDNEPIQIDSDSDSDSDHWYLRLSQSSPGKTFMRRSYDQVVAQQDNTSYSQIEEPADEEEFYDDIISIQPQQHKPDSNETTTAQISNKVLKDVSIEIDEEVLNDIISYDMRSDPFKDAPKKNIVDAVDGASTIPTKPVMENQVEVGRKAQMIEPRVRMNDVPTEIDEEVLNDISFDMQSDPFKDAPKKKTVDTVDGASTIPTKPVMENQVEVGRKAQMIEPLVQLPKRKSLSATTESKPKTTSSKATVAKPSTSSSRHSKSSKSSKTNITETQKEERKKKLKAIAAKDKEDAESMSNACNNQSNKTKVHAKVTSSNRGAFLTDVAQAVVKPISRKESPERALKPKEKKAETSHNTHEQDLEVLPHNKNSKKHKVKDSVVLDKVKNKTNGHSKADTRTPVKSLKPLSESEETGKPISKVDPLPPKKAKKSVRFSDAPPEVRFFEIEPGNRMNKTSEIKMTLVDTRQMPVFSLQKITLMKILRWNPHWLDEQINNNDPPPILGHSNPPLGMFQAFESHHQYVDQVGDLILMEIWETITQGYMKVRQNPGIPMKIISLPPPPPLDRSYELFNISVEIKLPKSELKNLPSMGDIMLVYFGPENSKKSRFLYVTHVQPPNNRRPFFTVEFNATFTEKMRSLRPGDTMIGKSLARIQNELSLFEAIEYLAGSPLSEAILRPEPRHFPEIPHNAECCMDSQWTKDLNDSQKTAVSASVSAALGDRPCIQMVQGPPGTGKSSVICSMVMAYFYDAATRRRPQRGKVLICATSNYAVDELVIRLLNIRQNLPKNERFRMVRVGRADKMHARAREISSQTLAQRDARPRAEHRAAPAVQEEISRLTAKINMWKTMKREAKDPSHEAYCEDRIRLTNAKMALLRGGEMAGPGEEPRPDEVARAERRIIEGADIVLTTLTSAINQKMRGLKRRIALCIVDEAGQAIEPEVLIPLTLDVTKLALVGDPQQLPGYICSQRAKRHGLGESLFARLAGAAEAWARGPVVLLARQYRMHAAIADYPNRAFYAGRVLCAAAPSPNMPVPPYTILTIASGDKGQSISGSNEMEAWGVARLVAALCEVAQRMNLSLAVITPYNAQKELIKKNLRAIQNTPDQAVEVNTVDSFQGQERDIVVVSLARSHGVGFLTDCGRVNVMLTRARHALIVALNPQAVMRNDQWRTLVEDAQRRRLLRDLPNKMCQRPAPGQALGDILSYIR